MSNTYVIDFRNGGMREAMVILFNRGFVFSFKRLKTLEAIEAAYPPFPMWNCLILGYDFQCKMVIHADVYENANYFIHINFEDFLKLNW